jgi:hypothetical protein
MMFKRRFDFQNVDKRECVQQTLELQFNIASAWMKKDQPLVKQLINLLFFRCTNLIYVSLTIRLDSA